MWPFSKPLEAKDNPVGAAYMVSSGPVWARQGSKRNYVDEGYQMNVIVYRAIKEIVQAAVSIKIELHQGDKILDTHPALDLLKRPNVLQSYGQWVSEMIVNRNLFGETFAVGTVGPRFAELWPMNPLDMVIKPSTYGIPVAYCHEKNGKEQYFPVDRITGRSDVFFLKMYNPDDYWRGQSPLMAAAIAADTFNAGSKWNYSLLRNSARPSGLIRFKGGYPAGEMIARMKEYFKDALQGADNSGSVPMLADDAEFVEMSKTPVDMDFLNTMRETGKYVASAFGVPLPLIDNDASTFNNYEQAKERLYTDTVIPMMQEFIDALGHWMLPAYGDNLEFKLDLDSIPALEGLRETMFARSILAFEKGVLTREESRIMMGFPAKGEGEFNPAMAAGMFDLPADELKALAYGLADMETKFGEKP